MRTMTNDNHLPYRRPDSPRPVSILTGGPFHIDPRYRRRGNSLGATLAAPDKPMLPRRHTLSEIVGYVDKQCAYIEGLTQDDKIRPL